MSAITNSSLKIRSMDTGKLKKKKSDLSKQDKVTIFSSLLQEVVVVSGNNNHGHVLAPKFHQ